MERRCPECNGILTVVSPADEMTSAAKLYDCSECQLRFESDATGWLREAN